MEKEKDKYKFIEEPPSPEELDVRLSIIRPWEWSLVLCLTICSVLALGWGLLGEISDEVRAPGFVDGVGSRLWRIEAPLSGIVGGIKVKPGSPVAPGEEVLELLHSDNLQGRPLRSPVGGRIAGVPPLSGRRVERGEALLHVRTPGSAPLVRLYIPPRERHKILFGQSVLIRFERGTESASIPGEVTSVSAPLARKTLIGRDPNPLLPALLPRQPFLHQVLVKLIPRGLPAHPNGFAWLMDKQKIPLTEGDFVRASITTRTRPPITVLLPFLEKH